MKYYLPTIKKKIELEVSKYIGHRTGEVNVEIANEKTGADLAVPLFKFATGDQKPHELAEDVAANISILDADRIEAASGFVNIWLKPSAVARGIFSDSKKAKDTSLNYGDNTNYQKSEIVIEYTDPNPFKEFHIGHVYSNTVGESISRLYEAGSANVHRVSYHGDVGLHIAKAIWGIKAMLATQGIDANEVAEDERAAFLGKAYAAGSAEYEKSDAAKVEIKELNKQIYEGTNHSLQKLYEETRKWSFDYFETIYQRLGVGFEKQYFERDSAVKGVEVVKDGIKEKVFVESEGAIIFKGEDYDLHTRVFMNRQGLPTYEAKDLGLALMKHADYKYDRSIIITGNEIDEYFKVVLKALELMEPEQAAQTIHISHGMVHMSDGKMSSRKGDVVTANWLLDTVENEIKEKVEDPKAPVENALGAIKYTFLKHNIGANISFDIEDSISLEGQSGPYIQYAAVRLSSILNKIETEPNADTGYNYEHEKDIIYLLAQYPEVVMEATEDIAPHDVAGYLFTLAKQMNRYYEQTSIQDSEPKEQAARLAMLQTVYDVFTHGLNLLGITVPKEM